MSPKKVVSDGKKRVKRVLSLKCKLDIFRRLSGGESIASVGRAFEINESTVRYIKKNEVKLKSVCSTSLDHVKVVRDPRIEKMESALTIWIEDQNQRRIPLSSAIIREKAKRLFEHVSQGSSSDFPSPEFLASEGWFNRFKMRQCLHSVKIVGESASSDHQAARTFPSEFKKIVEECGYHPEQVFNADETALFWKRMPSRTYVQKHEKSSPGYKVNFLKQYIGKVEHTGDITFRSSVTQTLTVSEQLVKLAEGITLLDKELKKQVLEKHEDLVSQATWVEKLQGVLSVMHVHVQLQVQTQKIVWINAEFTVGVVTCGGSRQSQRNADNRSRLTLSLLSSVERVRMKVLEPFNRIETQTLVLSRLHATSDLLRRASRIQQLVKRLPGLEPLRAAHIISELGELYQDVDLSGLEILEAEERQIKKETMIVEQKALKIVEQGLLSQNQEQVAVGIEIMMKLDIAEREVNKLMQEAIKQVKSSMKNALDMSVLVPSTTRGGAGRATGVNIPTNIQQFRSKLWSSWDNTLTSTIYPMCYQMNLIQNVLNNKLGDLNLSLPENEKQSDLAVIFWNEIDELMRKYLLKAAESSSYTKQALEAEYPKLLRLHLDFHKKLLSLNPSGISSKPVFPTMGNCLKDFENAYLNKCITIVQNTVREMFAEGEAAVPVHCPTNDNVDTLVKMISNELSVALVDEALTKPVARSVVAKGVLLFCQKAEEMLVSTPEASQVIDAPNQNQELNIQIANMVFYFSEQVKNVLSNLSLNKKISSSIMDALRSGVKMTQEVLNPLLASIIVAVDSILLTMHNEDYNLKDYNGATSLYMRELQTFLARAATTYLSPFHNQTLVAQSCLEVASRALELFLRNATLIRPISAAGQKKILSDFKMVEDAVSPLCTQLSELGKIYRTLRSLRAIVNAPTSEVVSSPVLGQAIPFSLAITLLISRGPPQLKSPHQSVDWTVAAYSEWLDNHTDERDRLEMLSGALQKYRKSICDQGLSSFDEIYPIIKSLLEKAFQYISTNQ